MQNPRAVLFDIDGVLTVSWKPLPGAVEAVHRLRDAGLPIALLTNTTSHTRAEVAETLARAGFPVGPDDVLTAPVLAAAHLAEHHPGARCLLLNHGDIAADLDGVHLITAAEAREQAPDVVILGGAGPEFGYEELDAAFAQLQRGAGLVALHRNLFWRTDDGLQLDSGAFLLGLEAAAGVEATVVGKPAPACFSTALNRLGVEPGAAVMVGDDVETDVLAAQALGLRGVLVRTGKFTGRALDEAAGEPDHVIDSVADLPALLDLDG